MRTQDEILEIVRGIDAEATKEAIMRLLQKPMAKTVRDALSKGLCGVEKKTHPTVCHLTKTRTVAYRAMETLSQSVMMSYVSELITAALYLSGPYQSREIMMIAAELKGGAPFITATGIPQTYKNQAGHILTMAGFERVSHYDRERKMPVKAWKVKRGWADFTIDQRAELVYSTIKQEMEAVDRPAAPVTQNTLRSFL